MLDATDYNAIDLIILFFCKIADSCFGNWISVPVTEVCTAHVFFVNRDYRRLQYPGWKQVEFVEVHKHIIIW